MKGENHWKRGTRIGGSDALKHREKASIHVIEAIEDKVDSKIP